MFRFHPDRLKKSNSIGSGAFGSVYPYQKAPDDQRWCVKVNQTTSFEKFTLFIQEGVLGFSLEHDALLKVHGFHCDLKDGGKKFRIFLLLPRMTMNFEQVILQYKTSRNKIPEDKILEYFHTLVCGIEYIHSKGIAHRDIKPANVLLGPNGKVKLADIGIAHFIGDDQTYLMDDRAGTKPYMAPEVINSDVEKIKNKDLLYGDLWSLGVLMLEVCLLEIVNIKSSAAPEILKQNILLQLRKADRLYGKGIINAIAKILSINPHDRGNATDLRAQLEEIMNQSELIPSTASIVSRDRGSFITKKDKEVQTGTTEEECKVEAVIAADTLSKAIKKLSTDLQRDFGLKFELDLKGEDWRITSRSASEFGDSSDKVNSREVFDLMSGCKEKITSDIRSTIKGLNINFQGCDIVSDMGFNGLLDALGSAFVDVERFSLNLSGCTNLMDHHIGELLVRVRDSLTSVKQFTLNVRECPHITDAGLMLFRILKFSNKWEKISLDFGWCDLITNTGLEHLASDFFDEKVSLKELSIDLSGINGITGDSLKALSNKIESNLISLKQLSLKFRSIGDGEVQDLLKYFGRNMTRLYHLTLDFSGCEKITDKGLRLLTEYLGSRHNESLESLSLSFHGCLMITNGGLKSLASAISEDMDRVTCLSLCFSQCDGIDDSGITDLVQTIGAGGKTFSILALDFSGCTNTTKQGLEKLLVQLESSIKDGEDLTLDFSLCPHVLKLKRLKEVFPCASVRIKQFKKSKPEAGNLKTNDKHVA